MKTMVMLVLSHQDRAMVAEAYHWISIKFVHMVPAYLLAKGLGLLRKNAYQHCLL
jgi:hypothetical protein